MRARYVRCNANDSGGDHFDNLWDDVQKCSNEHEREVKYKGGWAVNLSEVTLAGRVRRGIVSNEIAVQNANARVPAGLPAKPTTGIKNTWLVKRTERTQSCCQTEYHEVLGQSGTTIMMDTRLINTLFSTCAINGHGGLV